MANATVPQIDSLAYCRKLLDHLVEKDGPVACAEVPADLRNLMARAWANGMIEFGRANHSFVPMPALDGRGGALKDAEERIVLRCLLDEGHSWTGPKKNSHKPLRDLLAEEEALPSKLYKRTKVQDPVTKAFRVEDKEQPAALLHLRVRITDKGFGALAE